MTIYHWIRLQATSRSRLTLCKHHYKDWGDNIPDSCLCSLEEVEGTCQTISYRPCFPLIMVSVTTNADITLSVVFSLFVMAVS
ncbi:tetraspanin-8-like isoform X1 [Lates japonicus]|uniref:Tetraspanin-8-like isoform X1 n=1 Tax=Lates japonicus TaxID=270547 RepID=A0AAD3QYC3_LATJO|nr:tetraspanin-8-like isoform X1 [Lates japonicus]